MKTDFTSRTSSKEDLCAQQPSVNADCPKPKKKAPAIFKNLAAYYSAKQKEFGITNRQVLDFCAGHVHSMNQTTLSRLKKGEVRNVLYYIQWGAVLWDAVKERCKDRIVEFFEGVYDNLQKDLDAYCTATATQHRSAIQQLQQQLHQVEARLADDGIDDAQRAQLEDEAKRIRKSIVYQESRIH